MQTLGVVEDTLFVPMLGRIYASEHCPQILYDRKTLELKNRLPSDLIKQNMQNQYTLLASASRSANMDWIHSIFSGTQTGRCDCPAGLWPGNNLSPM